MASHLAGHVADRMKIETLKRAKEFKRVRGGLRSATPLLVIEGRRRPETPAEARPAARTIEGPRFGFIITRKVGKATVRNRIRRRLKEALRTIGRAEIRPDHDYVVVASREAHDYPFAGLQDALREAFQRLHRHPGGRRRRPKVSEPPRAGTRESGPSGDCVARKAARLSGPRKAADPEGAACETIPQAEPGHPERRGH